MRSRNAAVLALTCLSLFLPAAAAQGQSAYTKREIDSRLKDLESKTDADARFQDIYKRGEIDSQVNQLRGLISQNASKAELDSKLTDLQKALKGTLDSAEQQDAQRDAELEKRFMVVEGKLPAFPQWVSPLIASIALAASFGSMFASRAGVRETRRTSAYAVVSAWQALSGQIAQARHYLVNPAELANPTNLNVVIGVGNFYDAMAERWRNSRVDVAVLRSNNLQEQARTFWTDLQSAEPNFPAIRTQIQDWNELRWLAETPNA